MGGKTIPCLPNLSLHVPLYLQQFPSYTMVKSMRKSKNRSFHHIFVFPGDAPGAITLNVVWMEREFHAYKLTRRMCPSNYKRFWDRARYLWKNRHSTPPFMGGGGSRRNIGTPFGTVKLEWCRYPIVKKFRRYVYSFWRDPRSDGQTDGRTDRRTRKDRAYASHRAVKSSPDNMRMSGSGL